MTPPDALARRLAVWLAVAPVCLIAQVEPATDWQRQRALARLPELTRQAPSAAWRTHLQGLAAPSTPQARQAAVNAVRVALDVTNAASQTPFIHYTVPAMSEVQRLPDLYPVDGEHWPPCASSRPRMSTSRAPSRSTRWPTSARSPSR